MNFGVEAQPAMKRALFCSAILICVSTQGFAQSATSTTPGRKTDTLHDGHAVTLATTPNTPRPPFLNLPLSFEKNAGQSDSRVKFISRGPGYNLFLTADQAVLALWQGPAGRACARKWKGVPCTQAEATTPRKGTVLRLKMLNANTTATIAGLDQMPGMTNYFLGNDPRKWHVNVPNFAKVRYSNLYPGIDLIYYGNQQQLESDFILAPGADPHKIQFEVDGANRMRLDARGNLVFGTDSGEVRLLRPGIYQMVNGARVEVAGRYVLLAENRVGFDVSPYDVAEPLIIDPTLVYATFLGGSGFSGDIANAIAIDASGNAYVTGQTTSTDFPGTILFPTRQQTFFFYNTYVAKFNPAGNQLLYSVILGGNSFDSGEGGNGIGIDSSGNAYITGTTDATNFPTVNPFQATFGGGFETAFVAKIASDGASLVYSTYLGGRNANDTNNGNGIFVESSGNSYVVGSTTSPNFPTVSPMQATLNGFSNAFVAKFDPSGQPIFSTYLGGNGSVDTGLAVAVDSNHRAYVTGQTNSSNFPGVSGGFQSTLNGTNAFVSRFSPDGSALEYSTYLGGTNDDSAGNGIAVDASFNAYVAGQTTSSTFPLQGAAQSTFTGSSVTHAFITKLNPTGTGLVYSTFLGGEKSDFATGIAIDASSPPNVYVTGATKSTIFNLVKPMQAALAGAQNAFVTRLNGAGSTFDYSTYLGGKGTDQGNGIAVDPATGNAYVAGTTNSPNFPVLGAFQDSLLNSVGNAFVAEISPATPTTVSLFPPVFSFGQIGIGQTSYIEPVTLSNYSGSAATINSISLAGTNPGDFAQTNNCGTLPAALANGASCIISVTFSPTVQGLRTAILSVNDTGTGSPHTMTVSGIGTVPEVSLSKTSINFGSDPLNYPTFNSVQITNTGGVPLHISSVQFSGTNASEFTSASCVTTLQPGGTCFISISFIPTAAGARSATLLINDDAAGSPQTLPLTGTGVAEVIVRPVSINYGSQIVGLSTFAGDFTLINGSGVAITLANPAIAEGGTNPGDFPIIAASTTCQNTLVLQPGGTCIVEAKFLPTAAGARSATIAFNFTGFAGSPLTVNLTGIGLTGVTVATNPVNFGSQYVGFTSTSGDLLYNGTNSAITVTSIDIGGTNPTDFTATLSSSCAPGGVVPANTSCSIPMTFTPTALGARSATATINFTGASGSPIVVNLTGTGIPGPVTLSKNSLAYGGQITGTTSLPQRVILSNLSTVDVHSLNISTGSAVFTLASSSTCSNGLTVKAGASCAIDVVFAPTATGAATATMTVSDDDAGSPRTVALSGVGEPPVISVSTNILDFGNQTVGQASSSRAVFLINAGVSQVTITTPGGVTGTNAGEFAIVNDASTTCTNGAHVIGSGGTCAISLKFTPGATGSRTATLSFAASAGGTQTITLIGNGVLTPKILLSTTFVNFPNSQPTGTTSAAQTVTLTNTGNGPLTLTSISLGNTNAGDFTTTGSTCVVGTPIPPAPGPGNTCTFSISFAPVETGFLFATLSITSNSGNNPNTTNNVSLNGSAVAGGVVVTPASYDFGSVALNATSNYQFFTLENNTATPLVPGTIAFGGTNSGDFAFLFPPSCGTLAAFGGQCSIYVTFTPHGAGARSGQLQIPFTGASGSPINVNLSGTGSTILAFSPSPVVFPSVSLGGFTSSITATLTNGTASNVTLTNTPTIAGTNPGDFSIGFTSCSSGTVIAASGASSCQVNISFSPTARGSRSAQLVYTLSAGGPLTLAMNGSATGPVMSLSPSPLSFPVPQTVNTQSPTLFVTVSNTGDDNLFLSNETLTGANGNDFSFPTFNSCFSIAPGTSCNIAVAFTPFAVGARSGLLTVIPQAPVASQSVVLNGTGQAGTVSVTPTTLTYGSQNVGTTSGFQSVILRNTSNAQVTLTAVGLSGTNSGDYTIAAGTTCTVGAKIPALNGTCIANITFSPLGTSNPRTAALTITENVLGAHVVNLSGTGANPIVSVSPNPLSFVAGQLVGTQSSPQGITLSNFTASAVTISGTPAISGTNAGDFVLGSNTCTSGSNIPATTGTCTVNITFKPTAAGPRTATLTINESTGSHPVTLNGTGVQPVASLGSNSMAFGSVNLGSTSTQQTVTLTNTGTATLHITNVSLGGTNSGDFALATPGSGSDCRTVGSLTTSDSCVVAATFTPTGANSRSATISITDDASPTTQTINLSGTGTQPGLGLVPTTIPFGNQRLNTTSAKSSSVLTNTGTGPLTITSVTLTGTNPGDYALVAPTSGTDCRTIGTVAAGATCTIAATFTPTATGSRSATVSVADSATGSPHTLALTGTGIAPAVSLSTTSIPFANQIISTASAAQSVTLTNTGTDVLNISTVVLGGTNPADFAIASGTTCNNGATVAAGSTCVLNLTFTPVTANSFTATVTFTDDASPATQTVNLSGTGVTPPTATLSANAINFSTQRVNSTGTAQNVTITNNGGAPLNITSIAIGGTNASDFAFASPATTCPTSTSGQVAPAASCTLSVTFTPSAINARTASINITVTEISNPAAITLSGTGIAPLVQLAPSTVPFGDQQVSTTSVVQNGTLTNNGTDVLHITAVAITGTNASDFSIVTAGTSCAAGLPTAVTVSASANCTWSIKFAPTALGQRTASLTFTDDNNAVAGSTQSVTLTGNGTAPVVQLAPATVTFAAQVLNTTSGAQNGTLTNTGTATLHLTTVSITGTNTSDFAIAGGTCTNGSTVAANNGTCTWSVTFKPTAIGTRTALLTFTDDANPSPQTVPLSGTTPPAATLTPSTPIAFGNQGVGTASAASKVSLANPGGSTLHITSLAISGTNASDFAIAATGTTCTNGSTVAPNASCDVMLTFTPAAVGARGPATLTITDDASPSTTQTVSMSGTGIDFTLAVPSPPAPAVAGQPITATIQISPGAGGFPNVVTFAASDLPPNTTATFSPQSVTPGSSAATTTLTLTTASRANGTPRPARPSHGPLSGGWIVTALLTLLGMVMLRRGIRVQKFAYLPLAVLLLSAAIITGCTTGATGTPAGNYTVKVTATSGSLSHSTTVAITVQ